MMVTAPIFEIQRFSLHDGPGIRSLVFFKGCPLHCPWCQNPESQDRSPVLAFHRERCLERFDCEPSCPESAIRRSGFRVDAAKCVLCGRCVEDCASGALRLIGELLTPEQLMQKLRLDLPYYRSSGGGVTFSGGEPTLYPRFLDRVLDLCAQERIHTAIETAGFFSLARWRPILAKLDLIYFDLKVLDPERHARQLGGGYEIIRANAIALAELGFPVEFRMPLVPGFTDTLENIERVAAFLERLGRPAIHLLAYHNMGEAKIDIIGGAQPRLGLARLADERMDRLCAEFQSRGIAILNAA